MTVPWAKENGEYEKHVLKFYLLQGSRGTWAMKTPLVVCWVICRGWNTTPVMWGLFHKP